MVLSADFTFLDPKTIKINRSERQRKLINTTGLIESVRLRGIYNPIIITRDLVLIAGERRLTCALELDIPVPVRFADTLPPEETQIIELEENIKRSDLSWQDSIIAVQRIHDLYVKLDPEWTQAKTAEQIGVSGNYVSERLTLFPVLDNPVIKNASRYATARNFHSKATKRVESAFLQELLETTNEIFAEPQEQTSLPLSVPAPIKPIFPESIIQESFLTWAPNYSDRTFNLIHCDFPYGISVFAGKQMSRNAGIAYDDKKEVYWYLLDCLLDNLDTLLSKSGHVVFWFSMKYYTETFAKLSTKLTVNPYPLIWYKSDSSGIAPDPKRGPRQVYETAFLAYRGERPIVKVINNAYYGPTDNNLHPSAKPEAVLKYLFGMLVDGTTRLLDPTCGAGSSLRAAEFHGAEHVFGLDIQKEYVENAQLSLRQARTLRLLSNK